MARHLHASKLHDTLLIIIRSKLKFKKMYLDKEMFDCIINDPHTMWTNLHEIQFLGLAD